MSLIHDALKEMEKPTGSNIPLSGASSIQAPGSRGASGWLVGLAVGVVASLVSVASAWWLMKSANPEPPVVAVMAAPTPIPAAPVLVEPVPVATPAPASIALASEPAPVVAPMAIATPSVAEPVSGKPVIEPAPAPPMRASSVTFTDSADAKPVALARATKKPGKAEIAPVVEIKPAVDPQPLFAEFSAALAANDLVRGKSLLDQLSAALAPNSLSLLRAQAWYAFKSGDLGGANRLYRELLDRLPGDENATLSLASLEARAGRPGEAYALVNELVQRDPDSVAGQRMMKALREGGR